MHNFLVVDDERLICNGMKTALEQLGCFHLFVANTGLEALSIIKAEKIDAMLLDIAMPDMNGIELMSLLVDSEEKPLTVIVSGYDEFDYAKEALNYGAIDYILKPIDTDDVIEIGRRLEAILIKKEKQQELIESMRKFVIDHRDTIKQKLLYDILNNQTVSVNLQDIYNIYDIDLLGNFFCATVIYLKKPDARIGEVDFQVALKMVEEIIEKEIKGKKGSNLFNMENARYVLLFSSVQTFEKKYIQNVLTNLVNNISRVEGVECYIGKGDEVHGFENISNSYYNANDALDYRSMFGAGFVYDIVDYRQNNHILALEKIDRELATYLNFIQYDAARVKLDEYFSYLEMNKSNITPTQMHFFTIKCMVTFLSMLFENGQETVDLFAEGILAPTQMFSSGSLPQVKIQAMKLFDRTMEEISKGYSEKNKKIAKMVKKYIEENFSNNELSVNGISLNMNYSANYIGNVFKREYAMSINDFINKFRIDKAKRMMDETDFKIYEIAYKVGFSDQNYFGKTFKKYATLTPKEYRER